MVAGVRKKFVFWKMPKNTSGYLEMTLRMHIRYRHISRKHLSEVNAVVRIKKIGHSIRNPNFRFLSKLIYYICIGPYHM